MGYYIRILGTRSMKKIIAFLILLICNNCSAQNYFEGEILYSSEIIKKDSSFDLTKIISYPSKKSILHFKNGDWIQKPDTGMIEYQYFNHSQNLQCYKVRGLDTLLFYKYDKLTPEQEPVLSISTLNNTDTILGKRCNRLILQTINTKFTLVYSPEISINPEWFSKTKGGYYDLIYGRTKALYLMVIIETDRYISKVIAEKILQHPIPDHSFPDIKNLPMQEL